MEELHGELEVLKKALTEDRPAYDSDEEVADGIEAHDVAVKEQNNIDRTARYETPEDPREAERVCLSWSLLHS